MKYKKDVSSKYFKDKLFSSNSEVYKSPVVTYEPSLDYQSPSGNIIKALFYKGLKYNEKSTRIFAYYGVPIDASIKNPVPAVVLVHGGLGTAFAEWVDKWVNLGYAAIAMDTDGNIPLSPGSVTYAYDDSGKAGSMKDETFENINQPIEKQWMYFAISKVILANSLLRANCNICSDKIGICGISWGGLISSLVIGQDNRFAFAVLVYGCGYLYESYASFKNVITNGKVASLWDPSSYFNHVTTPTLWLNSAHDSFFSMDATCKSADATNGELTILPDLAHGHTEGWTPPEIYRFADSKVKEGLELIQIIEQPDSATGHEIIVKYSVPSDFISVKAYILYTDTDIEYSVDFECKTRWARIEVNLNCNNHVVTGTLPSNAKLYYVNIIGSNGINNYTSTTRMVRFY